MAKGILLNSFEKAGAVEKLQGLTANLDEKNILNSALEFSKWLSLVVEKSLTKIPHWKEASPIAVGSWGRGELCPASDLDVIFCGQNRAILKVVREVENLGLKFRYRQPQDMEDWTKNVEVMEANALFSAKAFTEQGFEKLEIQKSKILKRKKSFRSRLLKAMEVERRSRLKRYDSIANFLEPNIKFGVGGLRDIHQTLILFHWFPERFKDEAYALKILRDHKAFFLLIRQRLHLTNSFDILTASDQEDIADWLNDRGDDHFPKKLQKALSQVNFYSNWANERCGFGQRQWKEFKVKKNKKLDGGFQSFAEKSFFTESGFNTKNSGQDRGFSENGDQ